MSGAGRGVRVFVILESSYILLLTLGPAAQATSHETICQRAQSWWKNTIKERKDEKIKSRKVITRVTGPLS